MPVKIKCYMKEPHKKVSVSHGQEFNRTFKKEDEPFLVDLNTYEKILKPTGFFSLDKSDEQEKEKTKQAAKLSLAQQQKKNRKN